MNIKNILITAARQLATISSSPLLDVELLLANALQCEPSYLHIYPEKELDTNQLIIFEKLLQRRVAGEPIAYILLQQGFWHLNLTVTPAVLIPRAETELLVEIILQRFGQQENLKVVDLGTGSGAIALALGSEKCNWQIIATDVSAAALEIAKSNAENLHLKNIKFYQGAWCDALPKEKFDLIVSNPPYVAENDLHLKDLQFEPQSALIAGADGLEDIRRIILQAKNFLKPQGMLLLEHGFEQGTAVRELLQQERYKTIETCRDLNKLERATFGFN